MKDRGITEHKCGNITKICKRCMALAVMIVLVLSTAAVPGLKGYAFTPDTAAKEAYEKKLKEAKERKAELERNKAEAQALIKQYGEQKADIEAYISELDLKLNDISLRIFELAEEIEETDAELVQTRADLEEAKQRERDQYDTMKARIRYIYENGETTILDVFLTSAGIDDMLNQIEYVQDIQKYDNSLLERYIAAKQAVEDHEALLEATLEELNLLKEQEEFERATLTELYELKAAEIESLTEKLGIADEYLFTAMSEISSQETEIAEIIEAEEKRIAEEERLRKEEEERLRREEEERRLAEERAAQARQNASNTGGAKKYTQPGYNKETIDDVVRTDETDPYKMIWPLPGDHQTFSKFGYRKAPIAGASTYHRGWDIGGDFGAPIVAVLAGTAVQVRYDSSCGNYVKIDHGNGYSTIYMHMSKQIAVEGAYVQQGEIIGLVGSTGVSTGPHLHFGIKVNNVYVDPDPYIGHLE